MFGYVFHDTNGQNLGEKLQILWYLLNETCTFIHWPNCHEKDNLENIFGTWMGENFELGMYVRSSETRVIFCQYMWMTIKMAGNKQIMAPHVEEIEKKCGY